MLTTINDRIKDLRFEYGKERISQGELAKSIDIPQTTISGYEKDGAYVPHEAIIKYCDYFKVTSDYLLGRTEIKNAPGAEIHELSLSDKAIEKLKALPKDARVLSYIIEHEEFNNLMIDAAIYIGGMVDERVKQLNSVVDFARAKLEKENPTPDDGLTKAQLEMLHISQDEYFAFNLQKRLKLILHDIREIHRGDTATSDYADGETNKMYSEIYETVKQVTEEKGKIAGFITSLKLSILYAFKIRPNERNSKAAERIIKNIKVDDENLENLLSQSSLVEPNPRERSRAAGKLKEKE